MNTSFIFKLNFWLFSILIMIIACEIAPTATQNTSKAGIKNFDWLIGEWKRTDDKEGRKTYEYWTKINPEIYQGIGFTLENTDTVFKENIRLLKIDSVYNFEVIGVNEAPTYFKFTNHTTNKFTCENPENEFPKKIEYHLVGDSLKAIIFGDEFSVPFTFVRL